MKQVITLLVLMLTYSSLISQSVGIGTNNPAESALVEMRSTTDGLLIPRMTTTQRLAKTFKSYKPLNNKKYATISSNNNK